MPVVIRTEVVDAFGVKVLERDARIAESAFQRGAGVEHRLELPLLDLQPGEYLLRFVAMAGRQSARRDVRFSVQ